MGDVAVKFCRQGSYIPVHLKHFLDTQCHKKLFGALGCIISIYASNWDAGGDKEFIVIACLGYFS